MMKDTEEKHLSPANNDELKGHDDAEQTFLTAYNSGKLHHAWLISGAMGIGKATLAYRFARFLLNNDKGGLFGDPDSLYTDPGLAVFKKTAGLSHPDLLVIQNSPDPKTGKIPASISVEEARKISKFLHYTPAESDYRIIIIDSIDEMNTNAANAILKSLEEPPSQAVLLLVSHKPSTLLPTIRSRCHQLKLSPLKQEAQKEVLERLIPDVAPHIQKALVDLSVGSVGFAVELYEHQALDLYQTLIESISSLPRLDVDAMFKIAEQAASKTDPYLWKHTKYLLHVLLNKTAVYAAGVGMEGKSEIIAGEHKVMQILAARHNPQELYRIWSEFIENTRQVEAINMDKKQAVLNIYDAVASS